VFLEGSFYAICDQRYKTVIANTLKKIMPFPYSEKNCNLLQNSAT